ncbi:hypothetical protein HELRODRAFT_135069, partial [Helobdella robusta]|uniref:RING-type domain-containing protein n=1 Tax=Helobdella robusta TaxID=6412 RepID=T1EI68_HELRO
SRFQLRTLNQYFLCSICNGYIHNATTITECLHTFCKKCILDYTKFYLNCPICQELIHPTNPMEEIMHDSPIQDLLYKLMPSVYEEELRRERLF